MTEEIVFRSTRRSFLKGMVAGAAAVAATSTASPALASAGDAEAAEGACGMLIDLTRCTGCNSCALACKVANGMANPDTVPCTLDSDALSYVSEHTVTDKHGNTYDCYVKHQCMQCIHPACASACTVGALKKTATGPVVYDSSKCIGCRYCQYACPFGVPVYDWEDPLGLIWKCQMCCDRLADGQMPACAGSCPNGAIRFGKRGELLAQAHAQIESNPGRYVNHVFGEHEAGGTSVIYLSPVPFAALGFPSVGVEPAPRYAEAVMVQTPTVAITVAALAAAFQFMTRRRGMQAEYKHIEAQHADSDGKGDAS